MLGIALGLLMSLARGAHADSRRDGVRGAAPGAHPRVRLCRLRCRGRGRKVVNQDEYVEQLSLLDDAARMATRMAPTAPPAHRTWRERGQGPGADRGEGRGRLGLRRHRSRSAPRPSCLPPRRFSLARAGLARGQALWTEHCITCHRSERARAIRHAPRRSTATHELPRPGVGAAMTPYRVANTSASGQRHAMVPLPSSATRTGGTSPSGVSLRHAEVRPADAGVPTYALGELAVRSDAQITADLESAGVLPQAREAIVADREGAPPTRTAAPHALWGWRVLAWIARGWRFPRRARRGARPDNRRLPGGRRAGRGAAACRRSRAGAPHRGALHEATRRALRRRAGSAAAR